MSAGLIFNKQAVNKLDYVCWYIRGISNACRSKVIKYKIKTRPIPYDIHVASVLQK